MTANPLTTVLPEGWPRPKGYANGMIGDGRILFVGGQIGWDEQGRFAEGFVPQLRKTLENIRAVVEAAGGRVEHIARLTWYVRDMDAYRASGPEIGRAYREVIGKHFPSMAVVEVTRLVEIEALIEIEATAVLPR